MGLVTGEVKVGVNVTGPSSAPKAVKDTAADLEKVKGSADRASSSTKALGDRVGALKGGAAPLAGLRTGLDGVSESAGKSEAAAKGLADRIGAMKSGVGPVNMLREAFEQLKGNFGFVVAGAAAVIAAIVGLADAFDRSGPVMETWKKTQAEIPGLLEETQALIEKTALRLGNLKPPTDVDSLYREHQEKAEKLAEAISDGDNAIRKQREELERLKSGAGHVLDWMPMMQSAEQKLRDDINKTNDAIEERNRLVSSLQELLGKGFAQDLADVEVNTWQMVPDAAPPNVQTSIPDSLRARPDKKPRGGARRPIVPIGPGMFEWYGDLPPQHLIGQDDINAEMVPDFVSRPNQGDDALRFGIQSNKSRNRLEGMLPDSSWANSIKDFSSSLSEAIPGMSEFSGALGEISGAWEGVAAANDNALEVHKAFLEGKASEKDVLDATTNARRAETKGAIASVGALALAGAQGIKNERLRAGVLATIHLGLGTALMFVPGAQQEAGGHLAGAAILGGVALFGGSSGSGSSRGSSSSSRSVSRPLSERMNDGGWTVNVFGGWFGTSSPQETAAALHALSRRGGGSGFVPTSRAA